MSGDYQKSSEDDQGCGGSCVSTLIWVVSMILIICTFPFSLCVCIKMVQVQNQYIFNKIIIREPFSILNIISFHKILLIIFRSTKEQSFLDWAVLRKVLQLDLAFSSLYHAWIRYMNNDNRQIFCLLSRQNISLLSRLFTNCLDNNRQNIS